jgi:hypothetical protein
MVSTYEGANILLRCIDEVTRHIKLLLSLIMQDFTVGVFRSMPGVGRSPGEGRFHEVVFKNVIYVVFYCCGNDEGDIDNLVSADLRWAAFVRLCKWADPGRLRNASKERMID